MTKFIAAPSIEIWRALHRSLVREIVKMTKRQHRDPALTNQRQTYRMTKRQHYNSWNRRKK